MNDGQQSLIGLKGRLSRPSTWVAAFALTAAVLVVKPSFDDWKLRQAPTEVALMHSSSQSFFEFDWGAMWDAINSSIMGWFQEMQGLQESAVAAWDKANASRQQLAQAGINRDAAEAASQASIEAQDSFGSETIDACEVMEETKQNVERAADTALESRAMTQIYANKTVHVDNPMMVLSERLAKAHGDFCSPESLLRGRCPGGAASPKNMPDADIHALSVLGTTTGQSQTMSPDEKDAATRYVDWVTDPVPQEDLPLAVEKTPAGQAYLIEKRRRAAIASGAQHAFNEMIAARSVKN